MRKFPSAILQVAQRIAVVHCANWEAVALT